MKWRLNIRGKLFLGFGSLMLILGVTLLITQQTLKKSASTNDHLNNVQLPSLIILERYHKNLQDAASLAKQWAFVQQNEDHPERRKLVVLCDSILPKDFLELQNASLQWSKEQQDELAKIESDHVQLMEYFGLLRNWLCCFERYQDPFFSLQSEDLFLEKQGIPATMQSLSEHCNWLSDAFQIQMNEERNNMNAGFHSLHSILVIFLITLIFAGLFIAILTARSIVQPIQKLKEILQSLSLGIYDNKEMIISKDEIGEMNLAAKKLIFNFEKTKNFAQAIGSGRGDVDFEPLSEKDEMGKALLQMKKDLSSYRHEMEQKVAEQTQEILHQKNAADAQRQRIEGLYSDLKSSIAYAKRLQDSILPDTKWIQEICPEHFVLFLPKDVVSGDFYWFQKQAGKKLFAAADCTGHGVPGAFMSLIAHNALNHVTKVYTKPAQILNQVNRIAAKAFNQDREDQIRDGMDISLCSLDENTLNLEFSGAQNSLWIIRNGECIELKGDKQSVGKINQDSIPFQSQQFACMKGDLLYLFSDGYADQFGGEFGKKLMRKKFKETILSAAALPIAEQRKFLQNYLDQWRGPLEQVDDILVIGIQV